MILSAFTPLGSTVLVGVTAVQAPIGTTGGGSATTFRIRCLVSAYLSWGGSGVAAAGAPTAGSPAASIGMTAGGIETFTLPANSFFISNVAASFEITPGEGV